MILAALLLLGLPVRPARAHPLAQGMVDVSITRQRISVLVTVSAEEVLIAAAAAGQAQAPLTDKIARHGDYLLAHLALDADGRRQRGQVERRPDAGDEVWTYALTYPLVNPLVNPPVDPLVHPVPSGAGPVARVALSQDVLGEVGVAWGGPWEAAYLVDVAQEGRPPGPPRLLVARDTLTFDCDWSGAAPAPPSFGEGARLLGDYLRQGIFHILRGYDHLLFVAGLLLAAATIQDLVKVVVAFTVAHATTLTLCVLRVIQVRRQVIEPLIAASIVAVALQNVLAPRSSRRAPRLAIAFLFGLFHGCGFASGAMEAMQGYAGWRIGLVVVAFSLGVEIGHQIVVIPAFLLLGRLRRALQARGAPGAMARVQRYGSVVIGIAGSWYLWSSLR